MSEMKKKRWWKLLASCGDLRENFEFSASSRTSLGVVLLERESEGGEEAKEDANFL